MKQFAEDLSLNISISLTVKIEHLAILRERRKPRVFYLSGVLLVLFWVFGIEYGAQRAPHADQLVVVEHTG